MKAILVTNNSGYYSIPGAATPEKWEEVQAAADSTEKLHSLLGWGEYNSVWSVCMAHGPALTYFVEIY